MFDFLRKLESAMKRLQRVSKIRLREIVIRGIAER